jgi:hypothetical protein
MENKAVDTANKLLDDAIKEGIIKGDSPKTERKVSAMDLIDHLFLNNGRHHVTYG